MRCTFVGVGEAFDETLPNCSLWLETAPGGVRRTVLLDCGFTAPFALFRTVPEQQALNLDLVWISHFHGDHFCGLPALLLRFWEQKRDKPLTVVGQPGIEDLVCRAMDLAYPGLRHRFPFPLSFMEAVPGGTLLPLGLTLQTAHSEHPQPNLALSLGDGRHSVYYSGDGRPTQQCLELAEGVDLLVQESFAMELDTPGHGTVPGSIDLARRARARRLALVHVRRDVRRERRQEIVELIAATRDLQVLLPEPGALLDLGQ